MPPALELDRRDAEIRRMLTVIVDNGRVVQKQTGAIIRQQSERISAGIGDPEVTRVVDGKPFKAVSEARKPARQWRG